MNPRKLPRLSHVLLAPIRRSSYNRQVMQCTACFLERITTTTSLLPIATIFLSAAVCLVAWLQYRVARNKLRLDLFDRRYKVFEATRGFLMNPSFDIPHLARFKYATADAEFLFGSDVVKWLAELRKRATHLSTTRTLLERVKDEEELFKLANAEEADLSFFISRTDTLTKVFKPYLGFAKIK
jgi:hypothetical protein